MVATCSQCLGGGLEPRRFPPLLEALGAELTVLLSGKEVAAGTEVLLHGAVSCTSSRCHFPAARRRQRRSPAAMAGPNVRHHRRMAS